MKNKKKTTNQSKPAALMNRNVPDGFAETCSSITSGVISFFIFLIVTVFPLIYHDSYFDILETKYKCYYLCIIGMLTVCVVLAIVMSFIDVREHQGEHVKALLGSLAPKNWKDTFCVADAAVLVYWLAALISTFQSEYFYEAFWGNEGRYTGLFLMTLYVVSYFLISRCWKVKGWLLEVFLVSGMIMCFIGLTDYFQMDILSFRTHIKPEQSTLFTSTVGNINTYTAYVALIMGFAAAMFATEKSVGKAVWYYVCLVVSFFAIITGCSDNAYLALGALFAFLPFVLFRTWTGVTRYLVMVASFFTVAQCIDVINHVYEDVVVGLDSLFRVIAGFGGLPVVVVVLWGLVAAVYFLGRKNGAFGGSAGRAVRTGAGTLSGSTADQLGKLPVMVWTAFIVLGVAGVCFALFDANVAGNGARYGSLGTYLVFNDNWGTNRGYIWRKSIEMYQEFKGMHKLFGFGPDTFGILTTNEIRHEMVRATGQVFDNAHNEYLHLLVTIGPIGLAAYVTFVAAAIVKFCKNCRKHPCVIGCCVAVLCYSAQAVVNLNLPIATPIMWLMLSVGIGASRAQGTAE